MRPAPFTPADIGNAESAAFTSFDRPRGAARQEAESNDLSVIQDIPVRLSVELGRTSITLRSILQLTQGSVIELDGLAGEPMDVLINECLIAQGEVVVVNDKFGIRLTDITNPSARIRSLKK
ncbi:flagellar motor switch protein FliN [Duganella aceris]|uniref:Flagellar motor switch protein FliN n=1 Tax=Duganella aceris TaxID=2703883 RepID=A0ABX0FGU5_9BURK|nr:flagellar motor switch protein FliN [Duganella aceris]